MKMATQSSILACKIPWAHTHTHTQNSMDRGYSPWDCKRVGYNLATKQR